MNFRHAVRVKTLHLRGSCGLGGGLVHTVHSYLEEPGNDMHIGSGCCHKHTHGQAGVHILQVLLCRTGAVVKVKENKREREKESEYKDTQK